MSLITEIATALAGTPTQNERLIRLHTPLGAEVLLAETAVCNEVIGPSPQGPAAGLEIDMEVLSIDGHLELKSLIGQPVKLELELADGTLRPWHGHVSRFAFVGGDGGLARYSLQIQPWLWFLSQRSDSWVFQSASVPQIIDEVFADYAAQGTLAPQWRWELADPAAYPQRSLCIQHAETDLAFVCRLLHEEGLFFWWEHTDEEGGQGGATLVIADHNGALPACSQPRVRFTHAGLGLSEDSLHSWHRGAAVHTACIEQASQDYRANGANVALRPLSLSSSSSSSPTGAALPPELQGLTLADIPGAYAWEDAPQGQRLIERQMQALDALRSPSQGAGTLRRAAAGHTFTLAEHPLHDGLDAQRDTFVILGVRHSARSNLHADERAGVAPLADAMRADARGATESLLPNQTDQPVYSCTLLAQPAAVAVRMARRDAQGRPDVRLQPDAVQGAVTAIVVGTGNPTHTDRDHRVKVQFHWQRGANSSHRIAHPAGDNAPASDASGTWVRVSEAWAGANWGSNFIPRVGQEVAVGFVGGDVDRPVIVGAAYNGVGAADAQSNQVAGGAAGASGNAPAWFPGDAASGRLQGHQHPHVLAGHKTQELAASASGTGGYNQLVLDDTAQAGRIELATTSAHTRLQLGHLLHQSDNQRLNPRGHGADLATAAWGALRAGSGLLISAHGRAGGSLSSGSSMDAREPQAQLDQGRELIHALAESAQAHQAMLEGEPQVGGATQEQTDKQLPVEQALWALGDSLAGTDSREDSGGSTTSGDTTPIGGGTGTIAAWTRPDLVIAAPAGIGLFTPANAIYSAGNTISLAAGQDIQYTVQANHVTVANTGLVLFTYGQASNPGKPNTEVGIQIHAASGNVNSTSLSAATKLTADQSIEVASTDEMVLITAPTHVLLTAAGAALELSGENITLKGPGKVEFKAGMKELAGPGGGTQSLTLNKPGEIFDEAFTMQDELTGAPLMMEPYHVVNAAGAVVAQGITTPQGMTQRVFSGAAESLTIKRGSPAEADNA